MSEREDPRGVLALAPFSRKGITMRLPDWLAEGEWVAVMGYDGLRIAKVDEIDTVVKLTWVAGRTFSLKTCREIGCDASIAHYLIDPRAPRVVRLRRMQLETDYNEALDRAHTQAEVRAVHASYTDTLEKIRRGVA